jgi:hypothetical protein
MQRSRKQGGKTSETWFERGSVEFVRVFVGRSHPLSFGYTMSSLLMWWLLTRCKRQWLKVALVDQHV